MAKALQTLTLRLLKWPWEWFIYLLVLFTQETPSVQNTDLPGVAALYRHFKFINMCDMLRNSPRISIYRYLWLLQKCEVERWFLIFPGHWRVDLGQHPQEDDGRDARGTRRRQAILEATQVLKIPSSSSSSSVLMSRVWKKSHPSAWKLSESVSCKF